MKVVFLCSSLEPGRDGVGDYTRRLAAELVRQGHFSAVVSLNDKYISDVFNDIQQSEGTKLAVLRLPSVWPMKARIGYAKKFIEDFDPEWLSLQFVIFGFHPKGLPFGLSNQLAVLGLGRRWHIMFHELWLGMEKKSSKKHSLWGVIQRRLIKSLISTLNPGVIHTHTGLYQKQLTKLGFIVQHLPLFGNIPVTYVRDERMSFKREPTITFVSFGNIFPNAPVEDFASEAACYAEKNGFEMYLTIIGHCGSEQKHWADKWADAGVRVNVLGKQPVDNISKVLGGASIGLSTTPVALIEKSGSVAAMLEHGLPVICLPFPWEPKDFDAKLPAGIMVYKKGNLASILRNKIDLPINNNISVITHQFVANLNGA